MLKFTQVRDSCLIFLEPKMGPSGMGMDLEWIGTGMGTAKKSVPVL